MFTKLNKKKHHRNSWGWLYDLARGEIQVFGIVALVRKHPSCMFSSVKNKSWRFEDD